MRWLRFPCLAGLLALSAAACTPAPVREGGAIVRAASGDALYVADEDHRVVRVLPLPLRREGDAPDGGSAPIASGIAVPMPGPPAQVLITPDSMISLPGTTLTPFTQPRAVVYRKSTRTILVAGEGVRCAKIATAAISLLGGNQEGLVFWIDPPKDKNSEMPGGGEVMFPLRRGDRRIIQISTFGQGYDGPFPILPAVIIQEQWTDGDPAPTVTAM